MANQPAPWRQAVTWRLPRDLVDQVKAAASANDEPVIGLVIRALEREVARDGSTHSS